MWFPLAPCIAFVFNRAPICVGAKKSVVVKGILEEQEFVVLI
jgi:hypothetical protein